MRKFINIFIALIHVILILVALTSFLWLDWKIVLLGYVLYIVQKWIFKGCVLSFAQFGASEGKPKQHFTPYYLKKFFGFDTEEHVISRYLDYVVSPTVPLIAIIIQELFNFQPLLINIG